MRLFSSFGKNKQETPAEDSALHARAESDSQAVRPRKRRATAKAADGEGNAPVDPVLPEKKRARRRLVGAVALVLAVVIGLPMVLDSEPKALPDDVTIDIPSRDRPAPALQPAPGKGLKDSPQSSSRVPADAALDQREELVDLPPRAKPAEAVAPKAPVAANAPKADGQVAAAAKPGKPAQPANASAVAAPPVDAVARSTGVAAKASGQADTKPPHFTVQVAAFASQEKVDEVRGKLKQAGIATYTQKVATEGGERIRIRVGPLHSRQEADSMRARLSALGLSGTLVPSPS